MKKFTKLASITGLLLFFAMPLMAQATYTDNFDVAHDYLSEGTSGTMWDGYFVNHGSGPADEQFGIIDALNTNDSAGFLSFTTTSSWWAELDYNNGPMLYKNLPAGHDFELTVKVPWGDFVDYTEESVDYLAGGLMVRNPDSLAQDYIFYYVFDRIEWNCVFNFTDIDDGTRTENFTNDFALSVADYPWLKLTKEGSVYTGYVSTDGTTWEEHFQEERDDLDMDLQVGLAVATYTDNTGNVMFDDFKLYDPQGTTGIKLIDQGSHVHVFYRPSVQSIVVNATDAMDVVQLVTLDGRVIVEKRNIGNRVELYVPQKGLYLVSVQKGSQVNTEKIVVK
jgi:hypothetical protein